jgi:hypothetical protein
MSEDGRGPYLLDPLHHLKQVNFPRKLKYITFPLIVERRATKPFQKTKFVEQAMDWVQHEAPVGTPPTTTDLAWPAGTTRFRYIWGTQLPQMTGWDGTNWANVMDANPSGVTLVDWSGGFSNPVYRNSPIPKLYVWKTEQGWKDVSDTTFQVVEFLGLPDLPMELDLSNAAAPIGTQPTRYCPQVEWEATSGGGGGTLMFDEFDKEYGTHGGVPIPAPPSVTGSFKEDYQPAFHVRGIQATEGGTTAGTWLDWDTEAACGEDVLGGPVGTGPGFDANDPTTFGSSYPSVFQRITVGGTDGLGVRIRKRGKVRTYRIFGTLHKKGNVFDANLMPQPGTMWILCKLHETEGSPVP